MRSAACAARHRAPGVHSSRLLGCLFGHGTKPPKASELVRARFMRQHAPPLQTGKSATKDATNLSQSDRPTPVFAGSVHRFLPLYNHRGSAEICLRENF